MIADTNAKRLNRAKFLLKNFGLEALLVTGDANILYLTNFPGRDAFLLLTAKGSNFFLTDSRIYDEAKWKIKNANLVKIKKIDSPVLKNILIKNKIKRLGFESQNLTYEVYNKLRKALGKIRLLPANRIVETLRIIKSPNEILKIGKSSSATTKIFKEIRKFIQPGMTEMEIARELDIRIKSSNGTNGFETIVASGRHSSWPHAIASRRKIRKNDIVLLDFGAKIGHYCSDLTRVVFTGSVNQRLKKMYDAIKKAQKIALGLIRPGRTIASIVKKVNSSIEEAGFGKFILHALGHGIGLEGHELPRLSIENESRLKKGMVFTIEPGIYNPYLGGVRIEDVVCVTEDGGRVLTR